MKVTIFLCVILAIIVATSAARRCRSPNNQVCVGPKDEGRRGRRCRGGAAWWYNSSQRKCLKMNYKGCGGSANRYCSKQDCERKCNRAG